LNYLAHAYLSFNYSDILTGNIISDFVKGKKKFDYPLGIQRGINLHRAIDTFTDSHTATKEAKEAFRPHYRLYAGAFIDVVYDHFLANDENEFTENTLMEFSQAVYGTLEQNKEWLPDRFQKMFHHMKTHNWLFHYRSVLGTERSFGGLVRRSAYMEDSATANNLFEQHYQLLQACYRHFWSDVKPFAKKQLIQLTENSNM
jgi:acyl carrier protein phosphodiesterase